MSLGLLNNIAAIYANNNLNNTQASLQNTLTQLSSGSRINSGADDAAGLAVADGLHANEAALTQSAQNAQQGIGLLQTADGALSQVTNLLNRAVTLATEAANSTLNTSQVSSANQEYQNILTEIGNIGATTNYNGNSVFSNTATTLFVSDGTASGANVYNDVVGALSSKSVGVSAGVVVAATTSASGAATAVTVAAGSTSAAGTASTTTLTLSAATNLVGGTISIKEGANATVTYAPAAGVSADAFVTGFNAAATAAGVTTLTASNTGGVITFTGAATAGNDLVVTGTAVTQATAGSAALTASTPTTASATAASTTTLTLRATVDAFAGTLSIGVGGGAATSLTVASGTSGTALAALITSNATLAAQGVSASFAASTGVLTITGPVGAGKTLSTTGTTLTEVAGAATAGAGVDFTTTGKTGLSSLTADSAQNVLTSVTTAIGDVAFQRGILGANINELNAASNVASSESENLTSAESNIRSTNYGQATSDLAKYQVLSQTGISALAQANSVQQEILKLLQ
jgi:flagellin